MISAYWHSQTPGNAFAGFNLRFRPDPSPPRTKADLLFVKNKDLTRNPGCVSLRIGTARPQDRIKLTGFTSMLTERTQLYWHFCTKKRNIAPS